MHMADALLHPAVAGTMYAATGAALVYSVATLKKEKDQEPAKLPTMAVAAALVFAGQMIKAIGAIEGGVTAAVLTFLYQTRPEMLRESKYLTSELGTVEPEKKGKFPFGGAIIVLAISVAAIAGGFSLLASTHPDGLEWAIGNIVPHGEEEAEVSLGNRDPGVYEAVEAAQEKTSFLPDYAFKDNDSPAGTTVSGLVGAGIVAGIILVVVFLVRHFRKKRPASE